MVLTKVSEMSCRKSTKTLDKDKFYPIDIIKLVINDASARIGIYIVMDRYNKNSCQYLTTCKGIVSKSSTVFHNQVQSRYKRYFPILITNKRNK